MDSSLPGALQKMGSNFLVAAFVPAMGFVVFSLIALQPLIPPDIYAGISTFWQFTFVSLLFTTILGFTLFTLGTYTYKIFEGYTFLLSKNTSLRRSLMRRQTRRAKRIKLEEEQIRREIGKLELKVERDATSANKNRWRKKTYEQKLQKLSDLRDRRYALVSFYQFNFPPLSLILPTRFGNILRAAEVYSGRYGIDAVPIWGRLAHTMPISGMEKLDQANNQCLFLLNCCLLTVVFSCLSLAAAAYQAVMAIQANAGLTELLYFIPIDRAVYVYQQRVVIYLVLGILALLVARFFYVASLLNVGQYGNMIRSAFDLYRFGLIEALHRSLPAKLSDEEWLWRQIGEFMVAGQELGQINFRYTHPESQKDTPNAKPSPHN